MNISYYSKVITWAVSICSVLIITSGYASPPPIGFDNPDFVYNVIFENKDGSTSQYQVGLPSAALYQFIKDLGCHLPVYNRCPLVLDMSGNIVKDPEIFGKIARAYIIYDYLIPNYFNNPNGPVILDQLIQTS